MKLARGFLYLITFIIVAVIAVIFALRIWADSLTEFRFVPNTQFVEQQPLKNNAYDDPAMWFSRPGMGAAADPARWQPAYAAPEEGASTAAPADSVPVAAPTPAATSPSPKFAVFFIHPTSYLEKAHWNAPLDDAESQNLAKLFVRGLASPFNRASEIWAPRYRQATFGAFLTDDEEANHALDAAYRDVEQAFDYFLESVAPGTPIVLAGHSQGSVHLLRLLRERVAGTALQRRIAIAYAIGWPISIEHDLPSLGLPACATPDQAGCLIGWVSFAEPAEPGQMLKRYAATLGFDGQPRGDSPILCSNPISGVIGGTAPAKDNLGTLIPQPDHSSGELVQGQIPARCSSNGILLIGNPPKMGPAVLPGNNYHVYDIPLFWRNLQEDVTRRVQAWTKNH